MIWHLESDDWILQYARCYYGCYRIGGKWCHHQLSFGLLFSIDIMKKAYIFMLKVTAFFCLTSLLIFSSCFVGFLLLTDNLVEDLLGDFEYQLQVPYIMYRNAAQEVIGIWFYNSQECHEVANLFSRYLVVNL